MDSQFKLQQFFNQILIEVENNQHKGDIFDWEGVSDKIVDLEYHKAKMIIAIRTKNREAIKEYIADCALILAAIGDEFSLYDHKAFNTLHVSQLREIVFKTVPINQQKELRFNQKISK